MSRKLCGVGCSDNISSVNGKIKKEYRLWSRMIERCYRPVNLNKISSYSACTVTEDFKSFKYFQDWCKIQIRFNVEDNNGEPFNLDKDILVKGNKIYSPETCCFVPKEINNLFVKSNRIRGKFPIGVSYDTDMGRYNAFISKQSKNKFLGGYFTPEEAFLAYKIAKELYIKELADKWKDQIDPRVYETLMKYEVEITD